MKISRVAHADEILGGSGPCYAVGGLAVGESHEDMSEFWMRWCLPRE